MNQLRNFALLLLAFGVAAGARALGLDFAWSCVVFVVVGIIVFAAIGSRA